MGYDALPKLAKEIINIGIAILVALIFRSFLFEPFYIPSGSMKSSLLEGDFVFVSKYSYGYSRYSLPFGLPLIDGRVLSNKPERGDVVVFKLPSDNSTNYIKRLVGLPGDKIKVIAGELWLNDVKVERERVSNFLDITSSGNAVEIPQYIETLPNGRRYYVLDASYNAPLDNTQEYVVPEGHYFVMGDNRDNSQDSRVLDKVGYIPEANLLGPTNLIFFSSEDSLFKFWKWLSMFRTERFFSSLSLEGSHE